jgi:hypothetical protein
LVIRPGSQAPEKISANAGALPGMLFVWIPTGIESFMIYINVVLS